MADATAERWSSFYLRQCHGGGFVVDEYVNTPQGTVKAKRRYYGHDRDRALRGLARLRAGHRKILS